MVTITFDTLGFFERLKAAGVPEAQAKVQVEAMQDIVKAYDESSRKDLATKGDIQDVRKEIQDMRKEIQDVKHEILKWTMGMLVAQSALIVAVISYLK
jgi:uncharacterized membrane protein (DUF106 family)